MPLESLVKVNNLVAPRAMTILPRICLIVTLEQTMNNWEKSLIESFGSNKSRRCSNTMPKGPPIKKQVRWMNANLNMFKEKSKFTFGWNSIKEFKHMARMNLEDEGPQRSNVL